MRFLSGFAIRSRLTGAVSAAPRRRCGVGLDAVGHPDRWFRPSVQNGSGPLGL